MKLYSGSQCLFSHACRFVLRAKEIECDVVFTTDKQVEDAVAELNPYGETPTLADRDLVLYDGVVVNEYLDERFPHPPLMPSDPTTRAQARVMISRLRRDWLDDVQNRMASGVKLERNLSRSLSDGLVAMSNHFSENKYVLGEDFSLVDAYLVPLLWRLPLLQVNLPRQGGKILDYGNRMFAKSSFQESLSTAEREMRAD
ncbi:MAG: stringent starvation protein A [Proteobacteria bacterium]|jgi:stringent starvation protein A|nr:stringent starvation protein A [Pseudomonadota bacterium]MBT5228294.1 stringent starvation protein A [Pseudomonadota bacterium]MBT5819762.1 stringent starvation protein A [Pseudomonadota bacterium]